MTTLSDRDRQMCDLWINGMSTTDIADKFGCDEQIVRVARRKAGLKEADRKVKPKRRQMHERRPRSSIHAQIGYDISTHRRLTLDQDQKEFAKLVSVSMQRLIEIEAGVFNITVDELQRFAKQLGKSLHELMRLR